MRIAVAFTFLVLVVLVGNHFSNETRERADPADNQPQIVQAPDTTTELTPDTEPERPATTPVATPIEITGSIYDQDFEYSSRASAAADETMVHYPHETFLRRQGIDHAPDEQLSPEPSGGLLKRQHPLSPIDGPDAPALVGGIDKAILESGRPIGNATQPVVQA